MTTWVKRILGAAVLAAGIEVWSAVKLPATPDVRPAASVAGWRLAAPAKCAKGAPPEARMSRGLSQTRRFCRAEYAGPRPVRVMIFELSAQPGGSAFDAFQKWTPAQAGKLAFYRGRFFGVVESEQADPVTLDRFTVAFERATFGGSEPFEWRR